MAEKDEKDGFFKNLIKSFIDLSFKSQLLIFIFIVTWLIAFISPFVDWFSLLNPPFEPVWRSLMFIIGGLIIIIYSINLILKYQNDINEENRNNLKNIKDDVNSIKASLNNLELLYKSVDEWVKNITIWSDEVQKPLPLFISNMQDFFIHAPIFIANKLGYFQKELLDVRIENKVTDKNALLSIQNGEGIAITDPLFLRDFELNHDFIILSPLVIKPAIWVVQSIVPKPEDLNKKIFVYDKESTAYIIADNHIKYQNPSIYPAISSKVESLSEFLMFFQDNTEFINLVKQELSNGEHDVFFEGSDLEKFLLILSLLNCNDRAHKRNLKSIIQNKFNEFSYFFVTEPEASLIAKFFKDNFEKKEVSITYKNEPKDNNLLFTAIITTRRFLTNNPVAAIKFLKSVKTAILKTHSLSVENMVDLIIGEILHKQGKQRVLNATMDISIQTDLAKTIKPSEFYPNDLFLFYKKTTGHSAYTDNEKFYRNLLQNTFNSFHDLGGIDTDSYLLSDDEIENDLKLKFIFNRVNHNESN